MVFGMVHPYIFIHFMEMACHNKRQAAISHGRVRRSTQEQQSHTEEHERIQHITREAYKLNISLAHEHKDIPTMCAIRPLFA